MDATSFKVIQIVQITRMLVNKTMERQINLTITSAKWSIVLRLSLIGVIFSVVFFHQLIEWLYILYVLYLSLIGVIFSVVFFHQLIEWLYIL